MNLSFHVLAHDLKTTTGGSQSTEPEAIPWRLGICRVIAPFQAVQGLFSSPLISVSAHPCPRAAGRERWAGVTETLSPIQRRRPQGKEGQKIYTVSTSPLYVEIYSLTQPKADLELKTPQFFLQDSPLFSKQADIFRGNTWMSSRQFLEFVPTGIYDCGRNFKEEMCQHLANLARSCDCQYFKMTTVTQIQNLIKIWNCHRISEIVYFNIMFHTTWHFGSFH